MIVAVLLTNSSRLGIYMYMTRVYMHMYMYIYVMYMYMYIENASEAAEYGYNQLPVYRLIRDWRMDIQDHYHKMLCIKYAYNQY